MTRTLSRLAATAAAITFALATPFVGFGVSADTAALAQEPADGGRARMNAAGYLPILSQTTAAAACMLHHGYDIAHETDLLDSAQEGFNRKLAALQHGDPAIGIPTPENNRMTVAEIEELRSLWAPMNKAIDSLLGDPSDTAAADLIAKQNLLVLKESEKLFSTILNEYTNPFDTLLADALAVSFAERQEMFAEKLKREACEIGAGVATAEILEDYDKTISLFEATMAALIDGYPAAGIRPPPNEVIKKHLTEVQADFAAAKPLLQSVRDNVGSTTEEQMVAVREVTEFIDYKMHKIVVEYLLAAPGANDMLDAPVRSYAARELSRWLTDPVIIAAIRAHNIETENMSHEDLYAQNAQWQAELAAGSGPLLDKVLSNPASDLLKEMKAATSNMVTEVFIMDLRGANVAESEPTTAYWHLEEDRYQVVSSSRADTIYISDVHLEPGGEVFQAEVALPINDPETGERIGIASFGINVQSMF